MKDTSDKPIWQGVVHDCAIVLGTNVMVENRIQTVQADRTTVQPRSAGNYVAESTMRRVYLERTVYLPPGQAQQVREGGTM